MGRTIRSATQTWNEEEKALARFVHALRKSDQNLINELIALSHTHIAEASYASNLYPMDVYLVSMLLELYKKVKHLENQLVQAGVLSGVDGQDTCGITSLLELVNQTDPLTAGARQNVDAPEPIPEPTEYVDLQEGA